MRVEDFFQFLYSKDQELTRKFNGMLFIDRKRDQELLKVHNSRACNIDDLNKLQQLCQDCLFLQNKQAKILPLEVDSNRRTLFTLEIGTRAE